MSYVSRTCLWWSSTHTPTAGPHRRESRELFESPGQPATAGAPGGGRRAVHARVGSMVHLTRIYTRTGDGGSTRLVDNTLVAKTDSRVEAYGTVDEPVSYTHLTLPT